VQQETTFLRGKDHPDLDASSYARYCISDVGVRRQRKEYVVVVSKSRKAENAE